MRLHSLNCQGTAPRPLRTVSRGSLRDPLRRLHASPAAATGVTLQQGNGSSPSNHVAATAGQAQSSPQHPAAAASPTAPLPMAASGRVTRGDDDFELFCASAAGANLVPLIQRIFSDSLTPVVAYRCLVPNHDTCAPSFLLESVVNGNQQGRYSFLGAQPALEVVATQNTVTVMDHEAGTRTSQEHPDPLEVPVSLSRNWRPAKVAGLPEVFTGGWVGYAGYDTVRYAYAGKLPFSHAPKDDRHLPDLHLALYNDVVVFDQATKICYAISWVHLKEESRTAMRAGYDAGRQRLAKLVSSLSVAPPTLTPGRISLELNQRPASPGVSNMTKESFLDAIAVVKEHIIAGDIFQLVLSQRFERRTFAEPFEVYRALRVVNPSPYMVYMQARGSIIVSSSPEILCRVDEKRVVTNRPLAGTRRRGVDAADDERLATELLADEKECAEHTMLVDLGRNDVGKVATSGSVVVERLMDIERYSHVMHISSTVVGQLLPELDAWDALRAALPVGTVSGAPKVSAMSIIDELEPHRRGPYGGGIGHVSFTGSMDMALGLRTMIIPTAQGDTMYSYGGAQPRREWVVHLQAGAGLVADSVPESEYQETISKAAALGRAVDLAEQAFVHRSEEA